MFFLVKLINYVITLIKWNLCVCIHSTLMLGVGVTNHLSAAVIPCEPVVVLIAPVDQVASPAIIKLMARRLFICTLLRESIQVTMGIVSVYRRRGEVGGDVQG